jgi:hypothetical protein
MSNVFSLPRDFTIVTVNLKRDHPEPWLVEVIKPDGKIVARDHCGDFEHALNWVFLYRDQFDARPIFKDAAASRLWARHHGGSA